MGIIRKSFGLTLLLVYCLSVLQYTIQIDHNHVHNSNQCKLNSLKQESDPCHRSLVHNDLKHGCKHTTHFSIPPKHCSLCDIILHFDHFVVSFSYLQNKLELISEEIKFIQPFISNPEFYTQSRGPPSNS